QWSVVGGQWSTRPHGVVLLALLLFTGHWPLVTDHCAEAAISSSSDKKLEAGGTNQGGGAVTSSQFRQQINVGEAVAGVRMSSANFKILPGFLGASLSAAPPVLRSELDITILLAKTDAFGTEIPPLTWQKDRDPYYLWEAPAGGVDVAGYSYAIDGTPDDTIDTTSTALDIAASSIKQLSDGKHPFSVLAVNTAGTTGKPISLELWIDTAPPQITSYAPSPGSLLSGATATVTATVTDAGSGVAQSGIEVLVNSQTSSIQFDEPTGALSATGGGAWNEGTNSLTLRVADRVGNAAAPLVWSASLDATPPSGSVVINAGAAMTTSAHVTLTLTASDAVSGLDSVLISNQELTGYVEEPFVGRRELWKLNLMRGAQTVYVKFKDKAGNISAPVSDEIELGLLAPDTILTSGPAGYTPDHTAAFTFLCPEGDCVFSYAVDGDDWSEWSSASSVAPANLAFGNHYFRVKAAKEVNGIDGIQPDEEDPSPAERTWIVGVEPSLFTVPKGPAIKLWRVD
ncbi:MAG: hypothetical protein HY353_03600, partial [Candidatus Omnitrophica bacterium]|nr:hypothetical protein [Candidatus Omnitrophota bacterium]